MLRDFLCVIDLRLVVTGCWIDCLLFDAVCGSGYDLPTWF